MIPNSSGDNYDIEAKMCCRWWSILLKSPSAFCFGCRIPDLMQLIATARINVSTIASSAAIGEGRRQKCRRGLKCSQAAINGASPTSVCRKGRTRRESLALLFQSQSLPWCVEIFAMSSFQARLRLESSCFDSTLLIAKQSFFEVKVITAFVLQSVHWPQGADFSFLCHMRHYRHDQIQVDSHINSSASLMESCWCPSTSEVNFKPSEKGGDQHESVESCESGY